MKLLIIRNRNKIKQLLDFPLYFGMKHKYDTTNDHNVEAQTWFENFSTNFLQETHFFILK